MKKRTKIIAIIVVLLIATGLAVFTNKGKDFLGFLKLSTDSSENVQLPTILTKDSKNIIKKDELIFEPTTDSLTATLLNQTFENIEFKNLWEPGEFREDSNFSKIYPFPNIAFQEEIYDIAFDTENYKWRHIGVKGGGVVMSVDYSKQNYQHLLLGTEASGMYRSTDFGENWTKLENFPTNQIMRVAIDPNDDTHYLAIADYIHVYESFDSGNNWNLNIIIHSPGAAPADLHWNDTTIFARSTNQLIISSDNGQTWNSSTLPFGGWSRTKIVNNGKGAAKGTNNQDIYSIYITNDYGQTWTEKLESNSYGIISAFDISEDGERIIAALYNQSEREITFAESLDQGNTWTFTTTTPVGENAGVFWPQDISIDSENSNHFMVFLYMWGLQETFDGGQTLNSEYEVVDEYDSIAINRPNNSESFMLKPLDLRVQLDQIKEIKLQKKSPIQFSLEELSTKVLRFLPTENISRFETDDYFEIYLIPTDQGIYAYNNFTKRMTNIAKNLYLGDSRKVTVNASCPRIYAGLWHIGHFFIDYDNTVKMYRHSEKAGAAIGEETGCNTPVLYSSGTYLHDGIDMDYDINNWIWNDVPMDFYYEQFFTYHDDWWYDLKDQILSRINILTRQFEEITLPDGHVYGYYIGKDQPTTFWLLIEDNQDSSINLWSSTDLQNWSHYKNLDQLITRTYYEDFQLLDGTWRGSAGDLLTIRQELQKNDDQIIISGGNGVAISNDDGDTWTLSFPYAYTTNVIEDNEGKLYIGLNHQGSNANLMLGKDNSGIWYSSDQGETWQLLESDIEKSLITGLAIDNTRNILYASTKGESLLQLDLNSYFSISMPFILEDLNIRKEILDIFPPSPEKEEKEIEFKKTPIIDLKKF